MGVMPIPAATIKIFSRWHCLAVKPPCGPSMSTGVPGASLGIAAVKSPTLLMLRRISEPSGCRDTEKGWDCHQNPFTQKRANEHELPRLNAEVREGPSADHERG